MPITGFAKTADEDKQREYDEAISKNYKEMLKTSIELDTINAENNASLLAWQDVVDPSDEAKELVDQILTLKSSQEKAQESLDPYTKAKKSCDDKLNAEGANAALENIVRIQKDRIADQKELQALWKKVEKLIG